MKKYIVLMLLCVSSWVFACDDCPLCSMFLEIVIKNDTNTDCHLVQQNIKTGRSYSTTLPLTIHAGQSSKPYTFVAESKIYLGKFQLRQTNVVLSYQCGEDKFITFETERATIMGKTKDETVNGMVIAASNIDAKHEYVKAACKDDQSIPPKPGVDTMFWTLF